MAKNNSIKPSTKTVKINQCLSCGTTNLDARRRYCADECRAQMLWVLSLSKGLLKICNARYAAFSFNHNLVILDILPIWSKNISRFVRKRTNGNKPAEDLKKLVLASGEEWYQIIDKKHSKSYASLSLLNKNNNNEVLPESIKPDNILRPRFSQDEKKSMKLLQLNLKELLSDGQMLKIKSAYKKLAKIYHPDVGGDTEQFKKLNHAHQQMLLWAENPQFTSRKALCNCWSYDSSTNRWAPPL
jgi:hypothetical protein